MTDSVDDAGLRLLSEESQDLHADAMRRLTDPLRDYTQEESRGRRGLGTAGVLAATAGGLALATAAPAFAAGGSTDVMALQTAASLENLAVAVYSKALTLPFISGGNAVVKAFAEKTKVQHQDHANAFNAAAKTLGGKAQTNPDPKYLKVVGSTLPTLTSPAKVVAFAIVLEDVAAQTYTKNISQVSSGHLREIFGSVAPVEAQHKAVLLAVQALLAANRPDLITLPPNPNALPAAAGKVGFPDAFYSTTKASPVTEGAVS